VALQRAAEQVSGEGWRSAQGAASHRHGGHHRRPQLGAEVRQLALRFNQSRAVAIDMESATIAAQGYRFRVPYGTLLCVSDKPLHGEIKLPGQANLFYERAISEHIRIGIAAVDLMRAEGAALHSRKLRAFNEPPFADARRRGCRQGADPKGKSPRVSTQGTLPNAPAFLAGGARWGPWCGRTTGPPPRSGRPTLGPNRFGPSPASS
jgi:hypothetical protein